METVQGYVILKAATFETGHGFALGHNPGAPSPFVTWQFTEGENGHRDYYWGRYGNSQAWAQKDFDRRVDDYQQLYHAAVRHTELEPEGVYRYYSTQRPVDIGTYPKDPDNPLTGFLNYDERTSVEHGAFRAWGEVIYRSPLTPDQIYQYELRPSRDNPDVRRTMAEQAQVVGIWEMRNHVPENRRMTRYVHPGKFIAGKRVTPEELARQCRLAQDYPFVYTRGPRPKKSPQIEGR